MNKCQNCQKETTNQYYCSKPCASKQAFNNANKLPKKYCISCNKRLHINSKRGYCQKCMPQELTSTYLGDITLKEAIYEKLHRSSAYALVRTRARAIIKKLGISSCQTCGYNKHVEVCHIKDISTFSDDTKLSVINDISNLLVLCPNCHWEFDNNK